MLLLLGCSSVKELNSTDSSLIQSSRIGIFRDGGTIQIKLESINEEPMELFIDRRIGTRRSNPELYNALWVNAYPEKVESTRISYGTPRALKIKASLAEAITNYTKEKREDWTIDQQLILQDAYQTIN
jgi:hypothetical protein